MFAITTDSPAGTDTLGDGPHRGTVLTDFADGSYDMARCVTVQADGKIVTAGVAQVEGVYHVAVSRYNADGSPDTTFRGTGAFLTGFGGGGDWGMSVVVQPDGKVLVGGSAGGSNGLLRLNADGSPDETFNGSGVVLDYRFFGQKLALQADGKILMTGWGFNNDLSVARFNADGSVDTTFGNGLGIENVDITGGLDMGTSITVLPDGKYLVLGQANIGGTTRIEVARLNPDGSPDTGFNSTGKLLTAIETSFLNGSLAVQADGKFIVAGTTNGTTDFTLARYNADGSLDTAFGTNGTVVTDMGAGRPEESTSVAVQADGKILVAGSTDVDGTWNFAVLRYNTDGTLDTGFNGTGKVSTDLYNHSIDYGYGIVVQADGKIVVVGTSDAHGSYDFAIVRYNMDGSLDTTFGTRDLIEYAMNGTPVVLDGNVGIYDAQLAALDGRAGNYAGASVTLTRADGADGDDLFYGLGPLSFSDGNAVLSGVIVGTVSNAGGHLTIAFNGNATQSRVNGVITHIGYANDADAPPPAVVIGYTFNAHGATAGAGGSAAMDATTSAGKSVGSVTVHITGSGVATGATPGPDSLSGTSGDDLLIGLAGNDTLHGLAGNDTLDGGAGNDVLDGGAGSDVYLIAADSEHAVAEFTDSGASGTDEVRFTATHGTLTLYAGDTGIERIALATGTAALSVNASAVPNGLTIVGNAGANSLTGTAFNDRLDGGAGDDKLEGGNGDDTYVVDSPKDKVTERDAAGGLDTVESSISYTLGANLENLVLTGSGVITATGNAFANVIAGNSANNVIDGKGGVDTLDGGGGSDIYMVGVAADHPAAEFADSGTNGIDEVRFAATKPGTLVLYAGDTGIERVTIGTGTAVAPTINSAALNVDASAVANALWIAGNAGPNVLTGTAYADTLVGGNGNDTLVGGGGADQFVFNFAPNASKNRDTLVDFQPGVDKIALSAAVFKSLVAGSLPATTFWSGASVATAHDFDDRVIYNSSTGALYYDADGSGGKAAVQIAVIGVGTHPELSAADILVIA